MATGSAANVSGASLGCVGSPRGRHERNHVVLDVAGDLGVTLELGQRSRARQRASVFRERFCIERNRFRRVAQRVVEVVAGGKAARQVRKPNADCGVRAGVFDNGDVVGHSLLCLLAKERDKRAARGNEEDRFVKTDFLVVAEHESVTDALFVAGVRVQFLKRV